VKCLDKQQRKINSSSATYSKDAVCALAERAVIRRVDGCLTGEPRVKLTHICLVALQQTSTSGATSRHRTYCCSPCQLVAQCYHSTHYLHVPWPAATYRACPSRLSCQCKQLTACFVTPYHYAAMLAIYIVCQCPICHTHLELVINQ